MATATRVSVARKAGTNHNGANVFPTSSRSEITRKKAIKRDGEGKLIETNNYDSSIQTFPSHPDQAPMPIKRNPRQSSQCNVFILS